MKPSIKPVPVSTAPAEPVAAAPVKAKPVMVAHQARTIEPPARHEGTARTARYVQPGEGDEAHLFSYAGDFIATVTLAEGEVFAPTPPPKPEPEAAPEAGAKL